MCLLNFTVIRLCLHLSGLLYAVNPAELEEKYDSISHSSTVAAYPAVQEQFRKYWAIKEDWAIALRQDMPVRGSNTNNIVGVSFRTLKDKILKRQKCYNLVQLLSYTAIFISKFFCRKLLQLISIPGAAGASSASKKSETRGSQIAKEHIVRIEGDTFKVLDYYVDTSIGTCTCYFGSTGTACKHQFAVKHHYDAYYAASMPVADEPEKLRYLEVATGERNVPANWFEPLTGSSSVSSGQTAVPAAVLTSREDVGDSPNEQDTENEIEIFRDKFRKVCNEIEGLVTSDPQTLLGSATKFIARVEDRLKSKTCLASALATFGSSLPTRGRRGLIRVQPTAVARRKYAYGGARVQKTGPLPSGSYHKRRASFTDRPSMIPLKKKSKQPHSLEKAVRDNSALGKTHEAKMK